ncbi:MAG: ATP synthase F1 subunit delta [Pirellulaceae bacterium]|nr:ATP synthase F1 subunit delta [Pirellulaceae bacterium]
MSQTDPSLHPTALDSDDQQVGNLYAKAILGAAGSSVDVIVEQLGAVVDQCLTPHPGLESLLASPRVNQADKELLIERIFGGRVDQLLLNFFKVLCRRGRIGSLRAIQVCAKQMRDQQLGRIRVVVTSAFALTESQQRQIQQRLSQSLGKEVVLDERLDPNLLGGIQVRVGDQVFDGSVMGKMAAIQSAVSQGIQKAIRDQYAALLSS